MMKPLIRFMLSFIIFFGFLIPKNSVQGQSQPVELVLFEKITKQFSLPEKGHPESKVEETDTYRMASNRLTSGDTMLDSSKTFIYKQAYEKAILGGGAYCNSNLIIKIIQLSKLPQEDLIKLMNDAKNGFSQTIQNETKASPGLKPGQQTIGNTTVYSLSGSGSAPGGSPEHPGYDISIEKDSILWQSGDWLFSVDREITIEQGGGGKCGPEFQPVPPAMEWVEAVISISEQIGMVEGSAEAVQPVEDWIYPTSAECMVGTHPNYPLVLTIKLNYPAKTTRAQADAVRLDWEGNSSDPLETQFFQNQATYNPSYVQHEWKNLKNNDTWISSAGRLTIPLRFNLRLLPYAITPKTPYRTQVSIYGPANAQDKAYSKKLGNCNIQVDFVAVAHDIHSQRSEGVKRYSHDYLPPWEPISGPARLYLGDVLKVEDSVAFYLLYIDGTRADVYTKPGQEPFTMTIAVAQPEEKLYSYFTFVFSVIAGESEEHVVESGIKMLVTKASRKAARYINPAVGFVFLAKDVYDVGNYVYNNFPFQEKLTASLEKTDDGTEYFKFTNGEPDQEVALKPLGWARLNLPNPGNPAKMQQKTIAQDDLSSNGMVEITNGNGSWEFRTLSGTPLLSTSEGQQYPLSPGELLITNSDASMQSIVPFDPQSVEKWWGDDVENSPVSIDTADIIPLADVAEKNQQPEQVHFGFPSVDGGNVSGMPPLWVILLVICCPLIIVMIAIVGLIKKNRTLVIIGIVLMLVVVCIAIAAGVIVMLSNMHEKQPEAVSVQQNQESGEMNSSEGNLPALEGTEPEQEEAQTAQSQLSPDGPWLILPAEDGIWGMNEDGTGLTQLFNGIIVGPASINGTLPSAGGRVAFITAASASTLQDLTLMMMSLPDGKITTITRLYGPDNEPTSNPEICDPVFEAARASTIGNGLAWSPDGEKLAFVASLDGPTADVYLYSLKDNSITRLSDEPGQAYDLHWNMLPESDAIAYFSANCFGTGAGFDMEGAWVTHLGTARAEKVYTPSSESYGEQFISWVFGQEAYFVATLSGCPYKDVRMVNLTDKETKLIFEGCVNDIAVGPPSSLAVLTSSDFSDKPGLYLYAEPGFPGIKPIYVPVKNGREVQYKNSPDIFYSVAGPDGMEIHSVDWNGQPGWYNGRGNLPAVSKDGNAWTWYEKGSYYLETEGSGEPIKLGDFDVSNPFWYEELNHSGEIHQRLLFNDDQHHLYMLTSSDYKPTLTADHMTLISTPIIVFP